MSGGDDSVSPTADTAAQASINAQLFNYYTSSYKPLITKYISQTTDPAISNELASQASGMVGGEIKKDIPQATDNPVKNTRQLMTVAGKETGAQMQAAGGVAATDVAKKQNVVDIGRGQATTASVGMGEIASQSVEAEIANEQVSQQVSGAYENAFGSVVGAVGAGLLKPRAPGQPAADTTLDPSTQFTSYT